MGKVPEEETQRNQALFNDFNSKSFKPYELMEKYGISLNRIYKIVRREKIRLAQNQG